MQSDINPERGGRGNPPSSASLLPLYERFSGVSHLEITIMKLFAALPAILGAALQVAGQASNDAKVISELKDVPSRLDRINTISTDSDVSSRRPSMFW